MSSIFADASGERAGRRSPVRSSHLGFRAFWRIVALPIRLYKRFISPVMPPACRFEPTCSVYAAEAIETHGLYGVWLAVVRILKCHPFHPGGYDPVPPKES
jgi:putative membrane protein insertion efficiency factor